MRRLCFHVDGFAQETLSLEMSSTRAHRAFAATLLRRIFWCLAQATPSFAMATLICVALVSLEASERSRAPSKTAASTRTFESPGQFIIDHVVQPVGRQLQGLAEQPIAFPAKASVSRSSAPLKQITLLGGDRITAEIQRWDRQDDVELRLPTGHVARLPRFAIKSVSTPRGESEVLYEPFEEPSATIDATWIERADAAGGRSSLNLAKLDKPLEHRFLQPLDAGRIQVWFRVDSTVQPVELSAAFGIGSDRTSPLIVKATTREATISVPSKYQPTATLQTVALSRGWHCLTAALFADHAVITIDDSLLLSASRSLGPLNSLRFSATGPALLDDLQVSQFTNVPAQAFNHPTTKDDCVTLSSGDQWFGKVSQITPSGVVISDATGDRVAPWPPIVSVDLHQSESMVPQSMSTSGVHAVLQLQGNLDRPLQPPDRLHATIVQIERDYVIVAHPWLGRLALGWNQIARIERQFFGQSLIVDARSRHLGDAIREDFQRQVPDGLDWSTKFTLASPLHLLPSEVWLTMDVVDLEPSGPQTPPASKFLKELRSGQLLTQITINNQPAGDLNRWIRFRATPDSPERIRCLLPAGLLQAGENSLRLHQIPLKTLGRHYDNCELSNLRLEFVEPLR